MPTKRDYYEILGVSKSASPDEIKKAHRKLVRKFHPDANKDAGAQDKFKEIQEAYDILSEPDKRQKYDQFGHAGVGTAPPPGSAGDPYEQFRRQAGRPGSRSRPGGPGVSVEDFNFGGGAPGDFGSVFEQLFGAQAAASRNPQRGRTRQQPPPPPQRGQDIEHTAQISLHDAARGSSLSLQISRDGKLETIDIKIPPGVKEGSRIRLKGRGQQLIGGEPGDLFIITRIDPHPFLRRDDLDLSMDVPISLYEALLGTKVDVPTLDGPLTVSIPPGTSSHSKVRLKGHGIHRGAEKGDQFAIIKIITPKNLSEEEKQSILSLSKQHPLDARADVKW